MVKVTVKTDGSTPLESVKDTMRVWHFTNIREEPNELCLSAENQEVYNLRFLVREWLHWLEAELPTEQALREWGAVVRLLKGDGEPFEGYALFRSNGTLLLKLFPIGETDSVDQEWMTKHVEPLGLRSPSEADWEDLLPELVGKGGFVRYVEPFEDEDWWEDEDAEPDFYIFIGEN